MSLRPAEVRRKYSNLNYALLREPIQIIGRDIARIQELRNISYQLSNKLDSEDQDRIEEISRSTIEFERKDHKPPHRQM